MKKQYKLPKDIDIVLRILINKQLEKHGVTLETLPEEETSVDATRENAYMYKYTHTAEEWKEWNKWAIEWLKENVTIPEHYNYKQRGYNKYLSTVNSIDFQHGLSISDPVNIAI